MTSRTATSVLRRQGYRMCAKGVRLPRPVIRERAGVRVISNVERLSALEITLPSTFSRSTERGSQRIAAREVCHMSPVFLQPVPESPRVFRPGLKEQREPTTTFFVLCGCCTRSASTDRLA